MIGNSYVIIGLQGRQERIPILTIEADDIEGVHKQLGGQKGDYLGISFLLLEIEKDPRWKEVPLDGFEACEANRDSGLRTFVFTDSYSNEILRITFKKWESEVGFNMIEVPLIRKTEPEKIEIAR